jgi:probable rRNA maturation factor
MRATLCIRIVDDAEMAKLHEEHLSQPGPTDVLSFPADDDDHLGDVAIDWDAVVRQATSQTSQALLDEATVLLVHGLAHLMGHDHGTREQARRMHRLEQRALRVLGVPDVTRPYGVDR